ncbi:hypothetical protein BSZ19_24740 [Bradyrhizobium japonicum]|uniref:AI-2E family transporter n=1 Tax=Bradyrhizobium japonicum TaxID=375 RepID=A0A1Y2JK84_BRAJP|nr:AI-2E family transporter [Bradyrhizobium japonicum]OSJ30419.1 hypothetical protein BSZ19_24740 [Bradyrhizobium japonicum]
MQLYELTSSNDGELRAIGKLEPAFDSRTRAITQSAIAIAVVLLALWVVREFLVALTWAALIAIAIWPVYIQFARLISSRRSSLSAPLLFTLLTGLVLLVPLILVAHQVAQGSGAFLRALYRLRESGVAVPIWLAQLPIAGQPLELWWRANLSNPDVLREWLRGVNIETLTSWTGALGGALLHRLFLFAIMLIALFVALRDGDWLADRALTTADDLIGHPGARLVSRLADAIRAAVNGTIAAAILKGAAIGIGYVAMGVPHPLLFAALTTALAMVPLGAWIALAMAALILASYSSTLLAPVGLIVFGAAILLIGDNLIQPALIGGTAQLPFLLVLIGMLGGVESFGLIGLFLGPVIMAALLTVWRELLGVET